MKIAHQLSHIPFDPATVVTVGTFDGVHLGHVELLKLLKEKANEISGRSIVVTFEPHPKEIILGHPFPLLATFEERCEFFQRENIDICYVIPFTKDFSRLSAHEFILKHLVDGTGVHEIIEGIDHRVGHNKEAGIHELETLGKEMGFKLTVIGPVEHSGETVSSSRIRSYLLGGDPLNANRLLGYNYSLSGIVVMGEQKGREFGYPTANFQFPERYKLLPADGVYLVSVSLDSNGSTKYGLLSLGTRPTITSSLQRVFEVHILDFDGDLYGRTLSVRLLSFIRRQEKFSSISALIDQMDKDKAQAYRMIEIKEIETKKKT